MIVVVNRGGKPTSLGRLAYRSKSEGASIIMGREILSAEKEKAKASSGEFFFKVREQNLWKKGYCLLGQVSQNIRKCKYPRACGSGSGKLQRPADKDMSQFIFRMGKGNFQSFLIEVNKWKATSVKRQENVLMDAIGSVKTQHRMSQKQQHALRTVELHAAFFDCQTCLRMQKTISEPCGLAANDQRKRPTDPLATL
ncbi:hypothetical protein OROMI_021111 [Orobanche minor]